MTLGLNPSRRYALYSDPGNGRRFGVNNRGPSECHLLDESRLDHNFKVDPGRRRTGKGHRQALAWSAPVQTEDVTRATHPAGSLDP
jgi:hypothetical protein